MTGTDRVRLCASCQLHVYNLSAMPREEAEELIEQTEGRLCIRLYLRHDGTMLTQDCPIGLQTVRRWLVRFVALAATIFLLALGWIVAQSAGANGQNVSKSSLRRTEPFRTMLEWIDPRPTCTMGKPAPPPPTNAKPDPSELPAEKPHGGPPVKDE
jgi:hypothetical protein